MLIRICGACMVLFSTCGIGYQLSRNLSERLEDLKTLKRLVIMLRGEIKYASTPLIDAFRTIGRRMKSPYQEFLVQLADKMEEYEQSDFKTILKESTAILSEKTKLQSKDIERWMQFGENLGYLDKEMQVNTIDLYIEELEQAYHEAKEKISKSGRIYQYMGACCGILVILFLW